MNTSVPRVFIGYDRNDIFACHSLCQSIIENTSIPVFICPLAISSLTRILDRAPHPLQSTEFSFSRFLTPYLPSYEGWSLSIDCDMVFRRGIADSWSLRDERCSVMRCKHDYAPEENTKFLGNQQSRYAKKLVK